MPIVTAATAAACVCCSIPLAAFWLLFSFCSYSTFGHVTRVGGRLGVFCCCLCEPRLSIIDIQIEDCQDCLPDCTNNLRFPSNVRINRARSNSCHSSQCHAVVLNSGQTRKRIPPIQLGFTSVRVCVRFMCAFPQRS